MKERTLQILDTLIREFIEKAQPVASKNLLELGHFDISSATVRNEFSILEEVGLIESPHISAGKIPTPKGYRFFVNELLQEDKTEGLVNNIFAEYIANYKLSKSKENIFDILSIVAQLSGNVAFTIIENDKTLYLGLSNVLRSPEFRRDPDKAAQIVEVLEGRERFQHMVRSLNLPLNDVKIFIGEENMLKEISSCALLITRFETQNIQGSFGILGPMRMRYGFNKALLKNALKMIN